MSKFIPGPDIPRPSQGDQTFIPRVKIFEENDALDLENAINVWIESLIPIAAVTPNIVSIDMTISGFGVNLVHTAIVHYTLIG
jgi:hypothetical protein